MFVLVRSSYDYKEFEKLIQKAIETAKSENFYLEDLKYSTCFDVSCAEILHSAVLMFEEFDDD